MMLFKVRQLKDMATKLSEIADEVEGLWSNFDCCCEGECDVCRSLIHTSLDLETLAKMCRSKAEAIQAVNSRPTAA